MTLTERYEALKASEQRAQHLRAKAETLQQVALQQRETIDAEIRKHGVDPDKIEQELAALEAALDTQIGVIEAKITEEVVAYERIIAAAKAAGLQA